MKLKTTHPLITSSSIAITHNYSISSGKLTDRREIWKERPPSTYCLKIESFTKFGNASNSEKYESRLSNSADTTETDAKQFNLFKPYWGYGNVRTYGDITNPGAGWMFDGGSVVFGVDIFVAETINKWEVLSFSQSSLHNRLYKWTIPEFSLLVKNYYLSDKFVIGGRSWALKVYPGGDGEAQGKSLSLYVVAVDAKPYDKIYLKAKLRILNQKDSNHVEKKVESWSDQAKSWGFQKFVPFADLRDTSKGLLVNDTMKIEIEFEDFSSAKYFPS